MNYVSIWRLVRKDLYYFRWAMIGVLMIYCVFLSNYILRGFPTLASYSSLPEDMVIRSQTSRLHTAAALLTLVGFVFVTQTISRERIDKLNAFVMSFPISPKEYCLSKLLVNGSALGVAWLVTIVAVVAMIVARDDVPNGLIPLVILIWMQSLVMLMLMLALALINRSQGWLYVPFSVGHVYFLLVSPKLFRSLGVNAAVLGETIAWPVPLVIMLLGTIVLVGLIPFIAFSPLMRKRDII